MRARLIALPAKVASQLYYITDLVQTTTILEEAVREILRELSDPEIQNVQEETARKPKRRLRQIRCSVLRPLPKQTLSQWADEHLVLSPEYSAELGKFRSSRAPYQIEIMHAISDPKNEQIVIMTASQIGKSISLQALIGYYIHQEPSPPYFNSSTDSRNFQLLL